MTSQVKDVLLDVGGLYFGAGRTRVRTLLGSCISITLWHPQRRIGGMCHFMLPCATPGSPTPSSPGLYADGALRLFLEEIEKIGTHPREYIVKLFGGGSMFAQAPAPTEADGAERSWRSDICDRNVRVGRELLSAQGFSITSEDVGGKGSREVIFEIWSGDAWVARGPELPPR